VSREHAAKVRAAINRGFVKLGRAPTTTEISTELALPEPDVDATLRFLDERRAITLVPGSTRVWTAPPFSATPTLHWVTTDRGAFWGACAWCALGIGVLSETSSRIRSTIGGESEPLDLMVTRDGTTTPSDVHVHFALPAARWAESLSFSCNTILFFRDEAQVDAWSARHGLPRGNVLTVRRTLDLARIFFAGGLAEPPHRRSRGELAQSMATHGFDEPFFRF
jgi:hypothetical protein